MRTRATILRVLTALLATVGALAVLSPAAQAAPEPNGTFIRVTGTNPTYEVIGGALIYIAACTDMPAGCSNATQVSSLAGYAAVPANGTFVQIVNDGGFIGEFIGGALIHVDSCATLDCSNVLPLDPGGASMYMSAHPLPAEGSLIQAVGGDDSGYIGEVIGGAVIHVDSCTYLNSCAGVTQLDSGGLADYQTAHPLPTNGTFVQVAGGPQQGLIYRVAGGAFLTISDCASVDGCPSSIDQLDPGGISDWMSAHPVPADGTYLLGLPSNTYWEVLDGQREQVAANSAAVPVDDTSLNAIPVVAPATSTPPSTTPTVTPTPVKTSHACRVTRVIHGHKRSVACPRVNVPFRFGFRYNRGRSQLVSVTASRLERPDRVSLTCAGKGCPFSHANWSRGNARAYLKSLEGRIFRAGDRITLTVSRRRERAERIILTVRDGRLPRAAETTL